MHILNLYSHSASAKISQPYIYETYYPIQTDKFITFQPFSKPSKDYDLYNDVLSILLPILSKNGISVVQVGAKDERPFNGCIHTQGTTDWNQLAFLVKRGLLHMGSDSVAMHLASGFGKKIVSLFSNNYARNVGPAFSNLEDIILFEPDRQKFKFPSFSLNDPTPKPINSINPENIAAAVCKLLNLPFDFPYQTRYIGDGYLNKSIESVPDVAINISNLGIEQLIIRMDYLFNELILAKQLQICKCSIITNKPIDRGLLQNFASKIPQLVYELDDNHDIEFCKFVRSLGINLTLISYKDKDWIQDRKIDFCEIGVIFKKEKIKKQDIPEIKDIQNLYYKTAKFTLSNGKIYPSKYAWLNNLPVSNFEINIHPAPDNEVFFEESENFMFLEKVS